VGISSGGIKMTVKEFDGKMITANIRDIEIKSRRAQYTYLSKVAASCTDETAILYKDNASAIALIDVLERQNIDYRLIDDDGGFFSDKVVKDIRNIIKFAYNNTDIELFMRIHSKISIFMDKNAIIEACRNSKAMQMPVIDAAIKFGTLDARQIKHAKAIQKHLKELLDDPADMAVCRIVKYMGYGAYLERKGWSDLNVQILDSIGFNEATPIRLLERLEELETIINNHKPKDDCQFILSTINASQGKEYGIVYIMDAKDGIFPSNPIKERDKATEEELKIFDEEKHLYRDGVASAKEHLNIFSFKRESLFTDELLGKTYKPEIRSHARKNLLLSKSAQSQIVAKKPVVESEYRHKLEEIKTSGQVKHKTYGEGKVIAFNGDTLEIAFPSKTAKCKLKFMMENGLIL
jgi:DNA helicase-2/ATP-dependent DNA helicase PcrA